MVTYYDRTLVNGTEWRQPEDASVEDLVRQHLADRWQCEVIEYPQFHGIDWYAVRDKKVIANIEFKGRKHVSGKYPTVYLSQNKYLTLLVSTIATNVAGLFVARWADGLVRMVDVTQLIPGNLQVAGAGRLRNGETRLAVEPMIEIPVSQMMELGRV